MAGKKSRFCVNGTTGRPSIKTKKVTDRIIENIQIYGISVKKACAKENIPAGSFFKWLLDDKILYDQYRNAMNIRNEILADEIIDISDYIDNDNVTDENGNVKANKEWIMRSKLRIHARQWTLSKLMPKKYGDKVEIENTGEIKHIGNLIIEILPVAVKNDSET